MEIINMDKSFVHLNDAGSLSASTERFSKGKYTISFFHLTAYQQSHPDHWELHPAGDELIFLIQGKIRAEYFTAPDAKPTASPPDEIGHVAINQGEALIIPKGYWHRLLMVEESTLLVITKVGGTTHSAVV